MCQKVILLEAVVIFVLLFLLLLRRMRVHNTFTITFNIAPAEAPLAITNSTFAGTVGQPISGNLGITGGVPPYSVVADPTTLPPGVTLDASGNVGGTPTVAGTTTVSVTIADAQG